MANVYPNGIGGDTGAALALAEPLYVSGAVWYVQSTTGTDAATPAGRNREKPLATLAQAITNAADNDIIVCLSAHAETLTGLVTISKKLTIIGEGSAAGVPTVVFTPNAAAASLFSITATNVELHNLKIAAQSQANSATKITCNQVGFVMDGCYVECGALDDAAALTLASGADQARVRNTTFISTGTLTSAQPESALKTSAAIADLTLEGVVFSSGTVGWSNYFAWDSSAAAVTRLRCSDLSLLLGADVKLHASSTGRLHIGTSTGGSRVEWN